MIGSSRSDATWTTPNGQKQMWAEMQSMAPSNASKLLPSFTEGFGLPSTLQPQRQTWFAQTVNAPSANSHSAPYVYSPDLHPMLLSPASTSSIYALPQTTAASWSAPTQSTSPRQFIPSGVPTPAFGLGQPTSPLIQSPSTSIVPSHGGGPGSSVEPHLIYTSPYSSDWPHPAPVQASEFDGEFYVPQSSDQNAWLPLNCQYYYPSHPSPTSPPPSHAAPSASPPSSPAINYSRTPVSRERERESMREGSKRFACPYMDCRLRFARLNDQQRHSRIHTGEAPFACRRCGQRFKRSDARRRHELKQIC